MIQYCVASYDIQYCVMIQNNNVCNIIRYCIIPYNTIMYHDYNIVLFHDKILYHTIQYDTVHDAVSSK